MTFFGLKEGQDLETERHSPTKHSWEYPPPPGTQLINPFNKMGKVKILFLTKDPHSRLVRRLLCRRFRVRFHM